MAGPEYDEYRQETRGGDLVHVIAELPDNLKMRLNTCEQDEIARCDNEAQRQQGDIKRDLASEEETIAALHTSINEELEKLTAMVGDDGGWISGTTDYLSSTIMPRCLQGLIVIRWGVHRALA